MRAFCQLVMIVALTACVAAAENGVEEPGLDGEDTCGRAGFAHLVGQTRDKAAAALAGVDHRLIGPGDAVTMDYNAARINVQLDAAGIVLTLTCG